MIMALRILADYLWWAKEVALAVAGLATLQTLLYLLRRPLPSAAPLILFFLPVSCFSLQFLITDDKSTDSVLAFVKLISAFLVFLLGSLTPRSNKTLLAIIGASLLVLLAVLATYVTGTGFQIWGGVRTFSGGFTFKTDLAAFLTLTVTYLFAVRRHLWTPILWGGVTLLGMLTVIANARMYYLIFPLVVTILTTKAFLSLNIRHALVAFLVTAMSLGAVTIALTLLPDGDRMLLFDFDEGFSESNTQGRSKIWSTMIDSYVKDMNFWQKMIGGGFLEDQRIMSGVLQKEHNELRDCHNSYLNLLINNGIVGLFLLLWFLTGVGVQFKRIITDPNLSELQESYLHIVAGATLVFVISSFTNTSILYPQLSWPFFYFAGTTFSATNENVQGA